jgi:hypothetical protein
MRRETTIDDDAVVGEARMLGAAVITVTLVLIVLNTIMSLGIIAGETTTVTNESVTVDYDNLSYVQYNDSSYDLSDNVTVYDSGDVELAEGTDYNWYSSNGSLEWINTTETTDGETATVTYDYTSGGATGPYASVIGDVTDLSAAAFAILIVGFVVLAANAVLNYFGRGL